MAWWSGITGSGDRRLGGGGLTSPRPTLNEMPPDAIDASCSLAKNKTITTCNNFYVYTVLYSK